MDDLCGADRAIEVWVLDLSSPRESDRQQLIECLDSYELAYAQQFYREIDCRRFAVCRGMVKHIIGSYLALAAHAVHFSYTRYGKPFVEHHADLQFNLSHTQDVAVLAVTYGAAIGVDIEYVRPIPELMAVAREILSDDELTILLKMSLTRQLEAFYAVWTSKEAYTKAIGCGLQYPLRQLHVPITAATTVPTVGNNPLILPIADASGVLAGWKISVLSPIADCIIAIAMDGASEVDSPRIVLRHFTLTGTTGTRSK